MAVSEQTPYIEYTANGVVASFVLGFDCESKDHLIVTLDGVEPPAGSWSLIGGAVVFTTAPANGVLVVVHRNTPFSRTTDYQSYNNSFRPHSVNGDFDRVWWKIQELGVKDWLLGLKIQKFRDDVNLTAMEETLERAQALCDDTAEFATEVQGNLAQSQSLLSGTTAQANAAALSAANANSSKDLAKQYADNIDASLTAIAGGHKAYATLAAALANTSTFPQDSIIEITNDPDSSKNGAYQWNGADLTKSAYDPVAIASADATTKANTAQANAIANSTAKINDLKNASVISFDNSAFTNTGFISDPTTGAITNTVAFRYTGFIEVKKGDVISIGNSKAKDQFSVILYDKNQAFLYCGGSVGNNAYANNSFKLKVQQDGFMRVFNSSTFTAVSVVINRPTNLYDESLVPNKKALSLQRFYNDEVFTELVAVGNSVFTQNQVIGYFPSTGGAKTGYAYLEIIVKAGDLLKINGRMDAGGILAFFSDTTFVKSQVVKIGEGVGTLSEVYFEVPADGVVTVNTYVDALNDHSVSFYKKEKPYGLGSERALSHDQYIGNGVYNINEFRTGYYRDQTGAMLKNNNACLSRLFKIKAGQIAKLYQKASGVFVTFTPITVFDLSMNKIASVTTAALQSDGFYMSEYYATQDCYVQFTLSILYNSANYVDARIEIPIRRDYDFRPRTLYIYGDSQAILAGIAADESLRWPNIIASRLGYKLNNKAQAGKGMFRNTIHETPMVATYSTTGYIDDYQKGNYMIIEFWTNDSMANPNVTVTEFKTAYRTVLDYILKDKKWPASSLKMVGGFWKATKTQSMLNLEAAVKEIAAEYNIEVTNCTDYMGRQSDPASLIQSDGLHLNIAGNAVVADWLYSVFNFGRS